MLLMMVGYGGLLWSTRYWIGWLSFDHVHGVKRTGSVLRQLATSIDI